jgi:hypothetical protein
VAFDGVTLSDCCRFTACERHSAYRRQVPGLYAEVSARIVVE